jgi:spore coat protein CotH
MIKDQFDEDDGNIYKPESRLATFIESEFEKKNNDATPDFTDVENFIAALNSGIRTTNPAQWRTELEMQFNMNHFLKYLAVNNAIVNWDSYGSIARNYYLYNHSSGKLTWIPWDNNETLKGNPGITGTPPAPGEELAMRAMSLSMNEATTSWPLLNNIANDATYMEIYKARMKTFVTEVFTEEAMNAMMDKYHSMISPYAIGSEGEQPGYTLLTGSAAFTAALTDLKDHVRDRRTLVLGYVP